MLCGKVEEVFSELGEVSGLPSPVVCDLFLHVRSYLLAFLVVKFRECWPSEAGWSFLGGVGCCRIGVYGRPQDVVVAPDWIYLQDGWHLTVPADEDEV